MAIDSRFVLPPEDIDTIQPSAKTYKKRKRPRVTEADNDAEKDLYDQVLNGPLLSTIQVAEASESSDGAGNDNSDDNGFSTEEPLNSKPKPLQLDSIESYNAKVDRTGIIYLSRIPPGMGPSKVKHILSQYGETGRIYLVAADVDKKGGTSNFPSKKQHRPHRFVEGWVEFMDKKIARHTAEMLNAKLIGDAAVSKTKGHKRDGGSSKWRDDVWTMKYLPRFKWNMLSEQVAIEATTRAARLRSEIAQSKREEAEYLRQVQRAKNHEKALDKKKARLERKVVHGEERLPAAVPKPAQSGRTFAQREVVRHRGKTIDEPLSKVLDSIF